MRKPLIAVAGAAVVAIAAVFVWFNFIRDDAPAPFELTEETATEASGDDAEAEPGPGEEGEAIGGEGIDGTWSVGEGSEAGYRVVEDLANIQDFEAVGRTSQVNGTIDIVGASVSAASVEVDVASITSDDSRRDGAFANEIMNSAEFPTATFTLTEPIDLGSIPEAGSTVSSPAAGELTLRGVTNPVTATIDAQLLDGRIEIAGSVPVLFADYDIANPSNPFVTVRDEGQVEFLLLLDR